MSVPLLTAQDTKFLRLSHCMVVSPATISHHTSRPCCNMTQCLTVRDAKGVHAPASSSTCTSTAHAFCLDPCHQCSSCLIPSVHVQEFPAIRFRIRGTEAIDGRDLAAKRLACKVHERLQGLQRLRALPDTETCEFIVLDRCACQQWTDCCALMVWCPDYWDAKAHHNRQGSLPALPDTKPCRCIALNRPAQYCLRCSAGKGRCGQRLSTVTLPPGNMLHT